MAKVKFSALISEMRNKLNGSVFARNRGGNYLRTKVTPVNPQSLAQVQARALLTQFAQSWRGLTQAQIQAWNAAVDQWSTTDVFGDSVTPSGSALYIRLNINISLAGGTAINTPPSPVGADALTGLSLAADAGAGDFDVTFAPAAVPAGHAMFVETTPMLSPGISNANNRFRRIATLAPAATSPADLATEQIAKFGALVAGQKVLVRAKFINQLTGEVSQSLKASTIVA
jgi:hypothetical protein